jgi:SAM-dependent methyltransferase
VECGRGVDVSPAMLAALQDKAAAGADGPGADGSGSDGPGSDGSGSDGSGSDGPGSDGSGSDGAGAGGSGSCGPGPGRLDCVRGGFLSYAPAEPADGVYTRNALHQLPDFWKAVALQRIAGMLRPGGVLRLRDLVYDFAPGEADTVFADWFAGAAADPAAGYTAADYAEHIRTEYSTFRWLLEPMLAATGFAVAEVSYADRLYAAYTCVKVG